MANVPVSAKRISSMLSNRNRTVADMTSATSLSVDPSKLTTEDTAVEFSDLLELGRYFKRPWSYLLIDDEETLRSGGLDNRSILNQLRPPSPELLDEVETVAEMLLAAAELFPETTYEVPPTPVGVTTPAEAAGAAIRYFLGVSSQDQLHARDDFAALRLWSDAIQSRGVYVSQRNLPDKTIRAFSRVDGEHAVVVVDTGDSAYARIFSLLHEYCHVALRSTGLCDLDDHSAVERYCNAVAAAALMPDDLVRTVMAGQSFGTNVEVDDASLRRFSHTLRVSQAAFLIRLRDLDLISQVGYDAMESRRSARRSQTEKTRGGTYYPPRINRVGRRFARNVFGSLDDGAINRQDASSLLEIGEHLVASYRRELETPTRKRSQR